MRAAALAALIALPVLTAASADVVPQSETLDQALARARSEAAAADAQTARLEKAASEARDQASRLQNQQLAAAQAITAAEARISAADSEIRLIAARQQALTSRLERAQRPLSALLAGLASMAQRPPLLSLVAADSTEELVRVRILVDTTLPVIRTRTAGLRGQLSTAARLQQAAVEAQQRLRRGNAELAARRQKFSKLEHEAIAAANATDVQALEAGDAALAASETAEMLGTGARQARAAGAIASQLAREAAPPPGPAQKEAPAAVPFPYMLPSRAPVLVGLGTVSPSGIRSRGVLLGTSRGSNLLVPAAGTVRFAGVFGDYDGVVIIDHDGGWMSLVVNVGSTLRRGDKVSLGDRLGRALGQVEVELSHNGRRLSPAIIAGSSPPLSKGPQGS